MRSAIDHSVKGAISDFSTDDTLSMFEKMCRIRAFEENTARVFLEDKIKSPVYLSLGEESIPAALSMVYKKPAIFAQHRCHGTYIAYGGNMEKLIDELLHRETGCAQGMGGSASIHSPEIKMYGHDGHMGTQIPIAVGYAHGRNFDSNGKERVLAIMGDASAEEDYVQGALGWAAHKKLPILFVCEDNNLSILTEVETRRNWKLRDVARAYGVNAVEITDNPWLIMSHVKHLRDNLPSLINIHTSRAVRHQGGKIDDGPPEWDRYELVKGELSKHGLGEEMLKIEQDTTQYINDLWKKKLEES